MADQRIFAGRALREIRQQHRLRQSEAAKRLGVSAAYLSQLENDERPLTTKVIDRLQAAFPSEWRNFSQSRGAPLHVALSDAMVSATSGSGLSASKIKRVAEQFPEFAKEFIELERSHTLNLRRLNMLDDAIRSDNRAGGRLPWEEARDWFHQENNYVDDLDRAAEKLCSAFRSDDGATSIEKMLEWLEDRGTHVVLRADVPLRRYDPMRRQMELNSFQPPESLRFQLAWQIASEAFRDQIAAIVRDATLSSETTRALLSVGLGNYAAGAMVMPYEQYRSAAREVRHDIDRLTRMFGVSFEQACHRLSTLQRPSKAGIPMFFCRVDMAGNITKRHSATRLQFAQFGGACPLWVVHEAVAVPDRIHVQLAEMPDGNRYVSIAKGLVKASGSFVKAPRRYAVALGCDLQYARYFVYADSLNLSENAAAVPIGASCRICARVDCEQRAFPPNDRDIKIDPQERDIVPYKIRA